MQHLTLRCKHCQKEYIYCTYGNGPEFGTESGCSREYCSKCQRAIDFALSSIPVKYRKEYQEIHEPRLLELFAEIEKRSKEVVYCDDMLIPLEINKVVCSDYDNSTTIQHNHKEYVVEWNNETPDEKHIYMLCEFDCLRNEFSGNYWRIDSGLDYFSNNSVIKRVTDELIPVSPMEKPRELVDYMCYDNDFSVSSGKTNGILHTNRELRTYSKQMDGKQLKIWSKNGNNNSVPKVKEGINVEELVDFVDYTANFEKYSDSNEELLVEIKCY